MEFDIEKCAMLMVKKKRQRDSTKRTEQSYQESHRLIVEKEN